MSPPVPTIPVPAVVPAPIRRKSGRVTRSVPTRAPAGQPHQAALRRIFWLGSIWFFSLVARKANTEPPESLIGATLIIGAALLPAYLWVMGKVQGLPIFPACALTSTWTFALPLVSEHPIVLLFPGWNQLVAAMSVTGYLLIGTLCWYLVARRPVKVPAVCWMMDERLGSIALLAALGFCAAWNVIYTAGWINVPAGLDSIIRAITLAAGAVSCFVLSYLLGRGRLTGELKIAFFALFSMMLLAALPSLLLIGAMSLTAIGALAYLVSSKRLPWRIGLVSICIFGFLHLGKASMRDLYWNDDEVRKPVAPWEYPKFFSDWAHESLKVVRTPNSDEDNPADLLERASLMHWLLYFEASTPYGFPYLNGESYALIPRLFIPRFLDPDKPRGNEGNNILSMHYGIQTREDTERTSIAFGLTSEAYANFGYLGIGVLAAIIGAGYGKAAQMARGMPILSLRALFSIMMASMSIQAELCATSYATTLFQSVAVLLAFAAVFMRPRRLAGTQASLLD